MEDVVQEALTKGVELHKAGQLDLAKKLYASVIQLEPRHADANHNTGIIEMDTGNVLQALPHLRIALEEDPGNAQYWISYIDALIRHGAIDEARNTLALAKQKGAEGEAFDQLDQRINEFEGALLEAKSDDSGEFLTKTNILDTLKLDKALKLAKQKSKEGSSEEAQQIYKDILDRFPKNKKAIEGIKALDRNVSASVQDPPQKIISQLLNLYNQGQLVRTVEKASTLAKQYPKAFEIWNVLGSAAARIGRIAEAEEAFNKVNKLNPNYANGHNNSGTIRKLQGRLNEALDAYKKALVLKPNHFEAYYNMGDVLRDQGKLKEAIISYKHAINIKPDYSEAYNNMGNVLSDLGKLKEAIEAYNKALFYEPDSAKFYNNRGNALKNQGKLDEAIQTYDQALRLNSDNPEVHYNKGNALNENGDLNASIESYKTAIKLEPNYVEAYNNMGLVFKDKGDLNAAIESYEQALNSKPDYFEAYNNMGVALKDKGELNAAIDSYKKAIKFKPDFAEVWGNIFYPLKAIKTQISSEAELVSHYPEDTGSKYSKIAKSILNYRLHLGEESLERSLNEALSLLSNAENIIIQNPTVNKNFSDLKPALPDKLVALVHFGRSGTGLLHSLIDGHPEVSTLPSVYLSEYFDLSTWEKIISSGWNEIVDRFMAIYEVLFDASSTVPIATKSGKFITYLGQKEGLTNVGDKRDEVLKVNKKRFRAELNCLINNCNQLDAFVFFKLVQAAYDNAIQDINEKTLIFYHIHNPDTLAQLNFVKSVPNAKWVLLVREPIQSCESWVAQYFEKNDYTGIANNISAMLFELDNIIYNRQDSIGVRLEDLKESPRKTIPALCRWMGIEEKETLYEMTAQGKKWWGDPSSPDFRKDGMNPFGKSSIRRKVGSIFSGNDQFILRTLFYPFSVLFGYLSEDLEQFKEDLQVIRPMLDQMLDFEKVIVKRTGNGSGQFMKSGAFLYLRSGLIERWNTLDELHTYPNMIRPLRID